MVSQGDLETAIRSKIEKVSALVVSDVSGGCGQAYDVIIVSEVFEGLNTLKRHRLSGCLVRSLVEAISFLTIPAAVNDLLKEQIAQLHAFSQKTYTPKQYAEMSGQPAPSSAAEPAPAPSTTQQGLPPRPATLDTSMAQRGARVHHRSTSSNVSIPELVLTTDVSDTQTGRAAANAPRPLTPGDHPGGSTSFPDMGASISSPGGASGISRLQYNQITSMEFWAGLRDYLESKFMKEDDTSSPAASPVPGRVKGEAELVKVFEDFLQSQKVHLSASEVAKIRDGTGMFGM